MQLTIYNEPNCYGKNLAKTLLKFVIVTMMMMIIMKIRKYTQKSKWLHPQDGHS